MRSPFGTLELALPLQLSVGSPKAALDALEFAPRAVLYNCSFGVVGWGAWHAVEIGVGEFAESHFASMKQIHTGSIPPSSMPLILNCLGLGQHQGHSPAPVLRQQHCQIVPPS